MSKRSAQAGTGDQPRFDERLERLESIVAELEDGGLGLESAIDRYQEGIEHLKLCQKTLEEYRQRVEELTRDAEGALEPFADDPDADALPDALGE